MKRSPDSDKLSFEEWDMTTLDDFKYAITEAIEEAANKEIEKAEKAIRENLAEGFENTFKEYPPLLDLDCSNLKTNKTFFLKLRLYLGKDDSIKYETGLDSLFDEWCEGWKYYWEDTDELPPVDEAISSLKTIIERLEKLREECKP